MRRPKRVKSRLFGVFPATPAGRPPDERFAPDHPPDHLRRLRPGRADPPRRRRARLSRAHADPGAGDPGRDVRQGRDGRRADRHRQDRRLRAADHPPAAAAGELEHVAGAPPGARADAGAHPRARRPDLQQRRRLREAHAPAMRGGVRRRRHEAADPGAAPGLRAAGGHARPAARPRRAAHDQPLAGADPRARRGRPDARHGLPAGHPADHQPAQQGPPEPDVLCDLLGRDPQARRELPQVAAADRGRAPQRARREHHADRLPRAHARAQARRGREAGARQRAVAGHRVLEHQDRRRAPRAPAREGRPERRRDPRRQVAAGAAEDARRLQGRQDRRAGGDRRRRARPRHRRVARGDQLRPAVLARGLRAPDRPHRPGGRLGHGAVADERQQRRPPARRHREADQAQVRGPGLLGRRGAPGPPARCAARAR